MSSGKTDIFDPYRILETLSVRGPVVVFRARRIADGLPVVLKVLDTDVPQAVDAAEFRNAQEIARCLNQASSDVVRLLDQVRDGTAMIHVWEDVGGQNLARRNAGRTHPPDIGVFLDPGNRLYALREDRAGQSTMVEAEKGVA